VLLDGMDRTGWPLEEFPWVIQYNKRDLPGAESLDVLEKKLNFFGVPSYEGVAVRGDGVFDTLKATINLVVKNVQDQL